MCTHEQERPADDRETIEALLEENRWLKVLVELQASKIRVLVTAADPKGPQSRQSSWQKRLRGFQSSKM